MRRQVQFHPADRGLYGGHLAFEGDECVAEIFFEFRAESEKGRVPARNAHSDESGKHRKCCDGAAAILPGRCRRLELLVCQLVEPTQRGWIRVEIYPLLDPNADLVQSEAAF